MAGYQCSCGYQTGDSSNFNRHLGACEVETHGGPREHSGRKPKVDDEDPFDVGTRGGPREHSGRKPRVDNLNRHLGACEVETRGGPREHSGRKPKVDDEDPFDVRTRGGPREHSGRKPRVDDDDPPDLRDLKVFYKALNEMADLRVCAVCGEERGKQHFPAIKTYDPLNEIFIPMDSSAGVRSLILVDQNSDGTVLICNRCSAELRKHRKPKWAVQFREPDSRLLQLTNLEFRLIRPVVPIVSILRLPGEGQSATTGGSINFHNDTQHVASKLPRHPQECDLIAVSMPSTLAAKVSRVVNVRPKLVMDVLRSVAHDFAWKQSNIDEVRLDALLSYKEDDVVVVEEAEDPSPSDLISLSPDPVHLFLELPQKENDTDAADLFTAACHPDGKVHPLHDFQPKLKFAQDDVLNEYEIGRAFWALVFP